MRPAPIHLIVALVLLFVVGGVYAAWYAFVQSESARVVTLAGQVAEKNNDAKKAVAARAALATLSSDEDYIRSYFVVPNDVVAFLEKLQNTGKSFDAKVEVASVSADKVEPHGHITIALKITGSFDSVMRTIGAIEYGPYDSSVSNITLDHPSDGKSPWTATAVFLVGTDTTPPTP